MDAKSLQTLELHKVLERLAGRSAFSASKAQALALQPTDDAAEARRRQAETTEARRLLSVNADLSIGGAHDVRPQATAAARGAVLDPLDLLDVKQTLIAARTLARLFERAGEEAPVLTAIAAGLQPPVGVIDAISGALNERGEVLDRASEKLAALRSELRVAHDRLTGRLQKLLGDPKVAPMLQEPIITQRDGRFVIPLRAEFKGRVKAIVHDQSASGATLFVEPLAVVELNNQVRELELAERDEVRRILAEISRRVGEHVAAVVATVGALARLDLAFAKARYAEDLRASEPVLTDFADRGGEPHPGSALRLLAARHPLLDPAGVVPIDLVLDEATYALVITGPNTGGKTVTLKTAGLLALMAQCGLHLPAASGSELSVFDSVYADIGDEQSIEQSLSTFSSHITQIIRVLHGAGPRSLVVLDELGAGTDPQEGSALARAILDVLLEKRVTTLVATHYSELKAYAHATPGVRNASLEFDLATLRPTYRLTIGLPGRSNALAIADRLGLEAGIIERARRMLSPDDVRSEGLLDEIHRERDAARSARAEAELAQERLEALEQALTSRLETIEDERREVLEGSRREAEAETDAVRVDLERLRRRLAAAAQPLEALKSIQGEVEALEARVAEPTLRAEPVGSGAGSPVAMRLGERVRLAALGAEGVITEIGAEQAEVQIGRLRVRARLDELSRPGGGETDAAVRRRGRSTFEAPPVRPRAMAQAPPLELDLRGRMVEEALEELERRLDAACLAGLPFLRVIHGKGTGRLRQAIRQALKSNPYVTAFEPGGEAEGGDGVTIVRLAGG